MDGRRILTTTVLDVGAVRDFASNLRGQVLLPGDNDFESARKVWNGMIDKCPALIVRCSGVGDVISSVEFSGYQQFLVAVRGGGHSVAGNSLCDGGMVIDLSRMKGIRVDPAQRTARAQGGVLWGEFDHETQTFGLATTGGEISTTGIAGLTLGGGLGWLMSKYGLACDNLLSADIVTANGQFLRASASENEDLFWALRGGGGNFGIVTSFEYRLHQVGPVLGGMILYPMVKAEEVLRFFREYTDTIPDELTILAEFLTMPPYPPGIAIMACYCGALEVGERILRPLRSFGSPIVDLIRPMPYLKLQSMLDAANPHGVLNYWKSNFLKDIDDGAIKTLVAYGSTMPSEMCNVLLEHIHGAVTRVNPGETAFGLRGDRYSLDIVAMWRDPGDSGRHIQWAREFWAAMQPFSTGGVYVNYMGEEGQERVRAAYGPNYDRLVALKNKYDPTNFFRRNQNIKPVVR